MYIYIKITKPMIKTYHFQPNWLCDNCICDGGGCIRM